VEGRDVLTLAERFWAKVRKSDGCWEWTGSVDNHGYGQMQIKQDGKWRPVKAHRIAWFLKYGSWPVNALHHCDSPRCVRWDHLFEGTKADNTADMMQKHRHKPRPRKEFCKRGHQMTIPNTLVKFCVSRWKWQRSCRQCALITERARRERKRQEASL